MFHRVAIVGLGLIGGSLGLALRQAHIAEQVTGYDLGRGVCDQARKVGAVDQAYTSLADAVRGAELVVLATPVGAMRALLQQMATLASPGAVITDVASTKSQVLSWAEEFLPAHLAFVGGHPMAGKEISGVEAADPALFRNRIYCLTPGAKTPPAALNKVLAMIESIGARVRFLEPAEHDGQVALVSHLPFIASTALMATATENSNWGDASLLASSGFRDTTRLAAGSPEMYRDICLTNHEALVCALDDYLATLHMLREHIAASDPYLNELFARSQEARQQWQATYTSDDI
ncbi:MAG TPA: prephenate dehydrogenase/arogenate dehydrogenase family protein [Ktedonobacteraceae bacterium]|nr:prephenate dehydrogenase/arogenate dehydrogenase family protein [Ktedonobacteraceae bacterium]